MGTLQCIEDIARFDRECLDEFFRLGLRPLMALEVQQLATVMVTYEIQPCG